MVSFRLLVLAGLAFACGPGPAPAECDNSVSGECLSTAYVNATCMANPCQPLSYDCCTVVNGAWVQTYLECYYCPADAGPADAH